MKNQQQENAKDIQQQNENLKEQKQKQNILIFGGLGFVGKNYLLNLIKNQKYNKIITVDKQIPSLCIMPQALKDAFNDNKIQHYQLDISQEKEVEKLFLEKLKDENISYVVNLASETRFGFSSEHYQQKIANLAKFTAFYSNKIKVKQYVHFSSYFVYKKDLSQGTEDNEKNCDPVNKMGKYNLLAEKYVKEQENLNWVIIRPASIYGNFCETGITYRILGAIIYQFLDQPYRVLWDEKLRTQTIHIQDVCKCLDFIFENQEIKQQIFNLSDDGDTTQGTVHNYLKEIFGIKIEHQGFFKSNFAWVQINSILKQMNEKHLVAWHTIQQKNHIQGTRLQMVLYKENIDNYNIQMSNQKIKNFGFKLEKPVLNKDNILQIINNLIEFQQIPNILKNN